MIKIIEPLRPLAGLSIQQFHDHWRHPHGTMSRRLGFVKSIVQNHRIRSRLIEEGSSGFEGVAEVWLDSIDVAGALATDRYYLDNVVPDNKNFVDVDSLQLFWGEEEVIQPSYERASGSRYDKEWRVEHCCFCIKLMVLVTDCAAPSWHRSNDRELGERLNAYRHVRCHPVATGRFVGVRELYWPSLSSFERGVALDPEAFSKISHSSDDAVSLLLQAERLI
jgi:hypothetical protein